MRELDFPTLRLALVARVMDRVTVRQLASITDLTYAEWRLLSRLASSDGVTVGEIAGRAWVDRAEVSRAAASLERRGLAGRRKNSRDGRAPILFIKPAGRSVYGVLVQSRSAFHRALLADFTDAEKKLLDDFLKRIGDRLLAKAHEQPLEDTSRTRRVAQSVTKHRQTGRAAT